MAELTWSEWANANQGIIELIGLFLIIPFAILSDKILSAQKRSGYRKELKRMLVKELWINLNYVAQIETSYENNFRDTHNLHLPHFAPRIEILGKYFELDLLESLTPHEKDGLVEVYAQLGSLLQEFLHWKSLLLTSNLASDKTMYGAVSSTLLSHIDPLMRNMLELWLRLVKELGMDSPFPQIKGLTRLIAEEIGKGKWIRASYKATFFRRKEYESCTAPDFLDTVVAILTRLVGRVARRSPLLGQLCASGFWRLTISGTNCLLTGHSHAAS